MSDSGHDDTDKQLLLLEKRLMISYRQAAIGLREKLEKYLDKFEKEDAIQRALYDSGELSHDDYMAWRYKKIAGTKQWRDMLEQITTDMTHRNEIAASMIDDTLPDVYALNHNYGTYEAEVGSGYDTTYTLYDKNTVKRLVTEHDDLLPKPRVDIPKDMRWNRQHIQSAVLQGILQGESMGKIAGRMMDVTDMNKKAAMRNARTAVTGAENAGRIDSYIRAQNMGIKMKQMWMATLDGRTRDSHAIMDGEQQEVGKKFSNGCRYPGDPQGSPGEIWNCRCTTVAMVEGADPYNPNLRPSEYLKEEGLTYERWKEMHGERYYSKLFKDVQETESGKDTFDKSKIQYSTAGKKIVDNLIKAGVEYRKVNLFENQLSEEEIINRLAGGDKTKGSCMSLALCYAGNKSGMDVVDFRGGSSQDVIARGTTHYYFSEIPDVIAMTKTEQGDSIRPSKKLLKNVEEGKQYIFVTGRHAAIVKKEGEKLQYLELQSALHSGWRDFEYEQTTKWGTYKQTMSDTLKNRFGCAGNNSWSFCSLTDISCFKDNDELRDILGYINTAEDEQKKGSSGSIK